MRFVLLVLCLVASAIPSVAGAQSVTIAALKDNTLFEDANGDTSNGAGPALFAGKNNQGLIRRTLLAFDVAAHVPAGATVDSAVLMLHVSNSPNAIPRQIDLHRVVADWGEGQSYATGGAGAPATLGDATWLHTSYPASLWATPGGDFDPQASASALVGEDGFYAWSGAGLTEDVRDWQSQPSMNQGWLVQGEETGAGTARRFDSREHSTAAFRPVLTIFYSPATPVRSMTWGSVKSRYR